MKHDTTHSETGNGNHSLADFTINRLHEALEIANKSADDQMFQKRKAENEVARLRKYVEKLEIYSPENDWSHPEWRKLIGSKEQSEDPETLFKLYQFRFEPDIRGETNEFARLREEKEYWANQWNVLRQSSVADVVKAQEEVARLRELLEWYKSGMESCWHAANTYDGNYTEACDNVMIIASARLNHKINFAPAPEEPVL